MSKVMIIAELSANHNGNKQIAIDTIVAAGKSSVSCPLKPSDSAPLC